MDSDDFHEWQNLNKLKNRGVTLTDSDFKSLNYYDAHTSSIDAIRHGFMSGLKGSVSPVSLGAMSSRVGAGLAFGATTLGVSLIAGAIIAPAFKMLNNYLEPNVKGLIVTNYNNNSADYIAGHYLPTIFVSKPVDQDLKSIDDFFDAFGQRIDRFKVPELNQRDNFTFVKTKGAVVKSSNTYAAQQMALMLDNGTRFWKGDIGNV